MEIYCKHGIPEEWCATCAEAKKPPVEKIEVHGRAIVITKGTRNYEEAFNHLNETTVFVHIQGHPFLWAIERILAKAPNLKIIQVYPNLMWKLNPNSHLKICSQRGVQIVAGHWRPELAWSEK